MEGSEEMLKGRLSEAADKSILVDAPAHSVHIPDESLAKTIWKRLTKNPDGVLLVDVLRNVSLTAAKIRELCEKVIGHLILNGCKKGDVVAICAPNSYEYIVFVIALLKLGAIPAGINTQLKQTEIQRQLILCDAKIFVTNYYHLAISYFVCKSNKKLQKIILLDGTYKDCDTFDAIIKNSDLHSIPDNYGDLHSTQDIYSDKDFDPMDPALIVFSSGTTGLEKAVLLSNLNLQAQFAVSIAKNVRKLQNHQVIFAPFSHLSGCLVTLFGLALGYTNYVLTHFDINLYLELISRNKLETISIIPSIANCLAKSDEIFNYDLSNLKEIVCGTAPLSKEIEELLLSKFYNIGIRQAYGLSETCGMCLMMPGYAVKNNYNRTKSGSVGIPLPYVQIKIRDPNTNTFVGCLEEGEIFIKSPLVMLGYKNCDKSSLDTIDSDGWLKTGDLGYFDSDGYIYIVDRLKDLIKYKSCQISPIEIESVLISHPDVFDAGVFAIQDLSCGALPAAWVVRNRGSNITKEELEEYVSHNVASYKFLRGGIDLVDNIPRSPSGKIVRRNMKKL